MSRRVSGVYPVATDALAIVRRVSCETHPYSSSRECLGCELARMWRELYEGAGIDVSRYERDPFNTGGDAS